MPVKKPTKKKAAALGRIITFDDGFRFREVTKDYARKNWRTQNVFAIREDEQTESLIIHPDDIDDYPVMGVELGFRKTKPKTAKKKPTTPKTNPAAFFNDDEIVDLIDEGYIETPMTGKQYLAKHRDAISHAAIGGYNPYDTIDRIQRTKQREPDFVPKKKGATMHQYKVTGGGIGEYMSVMAANATDAKKQAQSHPVLRSAFGTVPLTRFTAVRTDAPTKKKPAPKKKITKK